MSPTTSHCHSCRTTAASWSRAAAEECQSATTALRRAEMMSRIPGSIGAIAFSRTGDPMIGEFGDAHLLRKFGNVPDDLWAGCSRCRAYVRRLVPPLRLAHIHGAVGLFERDARVGMAVEHGDADGGAGALARPANEKRSASIACSSAAALARASVSLRFHNSTANSSPPSRPITSEARTWR